MMSKTISQTRKLIYVAGSSAQVQRGKEWSKQLRSVGHVVTSGWPESVEHVGVGNPTDASDAQRATWSTSCICQLNASNLVWLQLPPLPLYSLGAFWEFGFAYAKGIKIVISGGDPMCSIFTALPNLVVFATDEEAYAFIMRMN